MSINPERKEQLSEKAQGLRGFYSARNPYGLLLDALLADLEGEALRPETESKATELLADLDPSASINAIVREILGAFGS
jgi:hypothetical protein